MRTNEPIFFTMASSPLVTAMDITEDFAELRKRILCKENVLHDLA